MLGGSMFSDDSIYIFFTMALYSKLILPIKLRKLWLKAVLVIGNGVVTDETFQSGSLLLVYQNISTVAHFTEKLQKYLILVFWTPQVTI